ncbi:MAG: hypothetical protein JRI59_09660 [Deltaproteobacteria bacterium]|nr:hypothetical protein [Deltaproteobacteria bacterium]
MAILINIITKEDTPSAREAVRSRGPVLGLDSTRGFFMPAGAGRFKMCQRCNEVRERASKAFHDTQKAMDLLAEIGGIAYQGIIAAVGGDIEIDKLLDRTSSPWSQDDLMENIFRSILRLSSESWLLLSENWSTRTDWVFPEQETESPPEEM